jgi:hypothetical protein
MIFSASFNADLPRENKDALKKCMKNFKNLQFAVPTHNSCRLIMYATLSLMTASSSLAWACKNWKMLLAEAHNFHLSAPDPDFSGELCRERVFTLRMTWRKFSGSEPLYSGLLEL